MKNFFFSAVLVILGAAAANSQNIVPVPNCYPCEDPPVTVAATQIVPIPNCYPCDDPPVINFKANLGSIASGQVAPYLVLAILGKAHSV